jgi:cytochrome c biogenesis protein CcdA
MIPALIEGVAQSPLPCSWVVVVPALLLGLSTSRIRVMASLSGAVVLFAWLRVAGWVVLPIWVAGLVMTVSALVWWRYRLGVWSAVLLGAGAAWAWQPCVGVELAKALNTAQVDPWAALPGLAAFMVGVVGVGLLLGQLARAIIEQVFDRRVGRFGAVVVGATGLLMLVGLYSSISSVLARWSTAWWA